MTASNVIPLLNCPPWFPYVLKIQILNLKTKVLHDLAPKLPDLTCGLVCQPPLPYVKKAPG